MNEPMETRIRRQGAEFEYPPTPDVAARVMRRIASPQPAPWRRSALALAFAALLVLFAAILAVPPARAAVLEFIRLGIVRIFTPPSGEPVPTGQVPTTATPAPGMQGVATPVRTGVELATFLKQIAGATSLETAKQAADFPLLLPTLPVGIGEPDWVFLQDADGDLVVMIWMDATLQRVEMSLHLIEAGSWAIDKHAPRVVQETEVSGQRAVWAEGPYLLLIRQGELELTRLVEGNVLIWAEGSVTYRLESAMSLEEAVRVAESLRPYTAPVP